MIPILLVTPHTDLEQPRFEVSFKDASTSNFNHPYLLNKEDGDGTCTNNNNAHSIHFLMTSILLMTPIKKKQINKKNNKKEKQLERYGFEVN